MASGPERRNAAAVAIYWICLALGVGALGLGWSLTFAPLDPPTRDYLKDLHISMGLMAAIALAAQFLLSIVVFAVRAARGQRKLRDWIAWALRQLVYLSLVATILTGFLDAVFRGQQLYFWGIPLPLWDANGLSTSEQFQIAHRMAAYALAGSILASLAVAIVYVFVAPTTSEAVRLAAAPHPSATSTVKVIADSLAQSFRFFGRFAFWVQFLLGFLSAAMLALSFMGHTVTPDSTAFGDAIYWASAALLLIIVSVMISSSYSKTAKKIAAGSGRGLSMDRRTAFWFLGPAAFVSAVGVVISFVGVGLSVALLIGKTVSQPPGIAITNPTKIVRALDVFVLMVNFNLLFAHFIGFAIAAWLSVSTLKAIHQYVIASQGAKPE